MTGPTRKNSVAVKTNRVSFLLALISLLLTLVACVKEDEAPIMSSVPTTDIPTQPPTDVNGEPSPESGPPPTEMVPETAESPATLEERPCELWIPAGDVAGETIQCGYVIVPAERDNPESKEVKLAYVLLKATGENTAPDPIIHVSGGPGISATSRDVVVELSKRYAPMRELRDVILYDQRGIGNSRPVFDCFAFSEDDGGNEPLSRAEEYRRCQEGMRDHGYPAETFSTTVSAADLVDVMQALEYPAYNLYGISYGARLLMSLMYHFPDEPLVRSIVLDSVDTLPEDYNTGYRTDTYLLQQALFESVFEECAANPACTEAYPGLRARFRELSKRLNKTPITLDEYTTIDGDSLFRYFFPFNSRVQDIPYQPRMIAELEQGVTATLDLIRFNSIPEPATRTVALPGMPEIGDELLDLYLNCKDDGDNTLRRQIALWDAKAEEVADFLKETCDPETAAAAIRITDKNPGIFNHIITRYADDGIISPNPGLNGKLVCTEQFPFREDFGQIEANLRAAGMPDFFVEETVDSMISNSEGCEAWQDALRAPTPERYGDYATLIFNGQFDSLTPPAFAATAAAAIPRAQYIPIPNAWHSIMGNYGSCPTEITLQFLTDPSAAVDAACTEEMKIEFVLPEK
jgi:pimeloyl-ACP methyl ester carboxylesterase